MKIMCNEDTNQINRIQDCVYYQGDLPRFELHEQGVILNFEELQALDIIFFLLGREMEYLLCT